MLIQTCSYAGLYAGIDCQDSCELLEVELDSYRQQRCRMGIKRARTGRTQMASKTYTGDVDALTGRAARDDWSQSSFAARDRANPPPAIVCERLSSQAPAKEGFHTCVATRST